MLQSSPTDRAEMRIRAAIQNSGLVVRQRAGIGDADHRVLAQQRRDPDPASELLDASVSCRRVIDGDDPSGST